MDEVTMEDSLLESLDSALQNCTTEELSQMENACGYPTFSGEEGEKFRTYRITALVLRSAGDSSVLRRVVKKLGELNRRPSYAYISFISPDLSPALTEYWLKRVEELDSEKLTELERLLGIKTHEQMHPHERANIIMSFAEERAYDFCVLTTYLS